MSRNISKIEASLNRFHPVLYISLVSLLLALVTFLFYGAYNTSTTAADSNGGSAINFDKETIQKIEELNTPKDNIHNFKLPNGRINPFV